MKIANVIFSISLFVSSAEAFPQMHQEIGVDGKYIPDVMRADRLNIFPKPVKQNVGLQPLPYVENGVAASFRPSFLTLPATGWQSRHDFSQNRGYADAAVGSRLSTALSAGYRFADSKSVLFGIRLQHNSTSLWKPRLSGKRISGNRWRTDDAAGLYGSYLVKGAGRIDASFDFSCGHFKYLVPDLSEIPSQTLTDISAKIAWTPLSRPSGTAIWSASAGVRHFAYSHPGAYEADKGKVPGRETLLRAGGGILVPWGEGNLFGTDATLDVIITGGSSGIDINDYSVFKLTPFYKFSYGHFDVKAGAEIDLSVNAGPAGERYPLLHISPAVNAGLQTGQFGFYITVSGGTEPTTLSRLRQLDYYACPLLQTTMPTFTPFLFSAGINIGSFAGFSAGMQVSWKKERNILLGGYYSSMHESPLPLENVFNGPAFMNLRGYRLHADLEYDCQGIFKISAEGSYQPQDYGNGWMNGYDRPKITGSVKVRCNPVARLGITAGYEFRLKRCIYIPLSATQGIPDGRYSVGTAGLPDLGYLNLSASWQLDKRSAVSLQADNIFNSTKQVLPGQPAQGIVLMAGYRLLF